jgi:hypothetical protein
MPFNPDQLKATLQNLHEQLAAIDSLDKSSRDDLTAALQEIQQALQNKTSPVTKPLMWRLGQAASKFEASHPALSGTISSLIDTLGRSGI